MAYILVDFLDNFLPLWKITISSCHLILFLLSVYARLIHLILGLLSFMKNLCWEAMLLSDTKSGAVHPPWLAATWNKQYWCLKIPFVLAQVQPRLSGSHWHAHEHNSLVALGSVQWWGDACALFPWWKTFHSVPDVVGQATAPAGVAENIPHPTEFLSGSFS